MLAGAQCGECDHQFSQVAECRIEQAADRIPGSRRNGLGGLTEQRCQRNDRQHRQHEQEGMGIGTDGMRQQHRGHEDEQPERRVAAEDRHDRSHRGGGSGMAVASNTRLTTAKKKPVDQPHMRMPVNASTPPTSRHAGGSTRSP
ncbi:hypothetical protein D3C83_25810 [compost metagenome]